MQLKLERLDIDIDSRVAIMLIHDKQSSTYAHINFYCRALLLKILIWYLRHMYRETNQATDWLAKKSTTMMERSRMLTLPIEELSEILDDVKGSYHPRNLKCNDVREQLVVASTFFCHSCTPT